VTIEWSTSWTNLTTLNLSYVHGVFQGLTEFIFRCMRQQSQSFCNLYSHFLLTTLGSVVHSVLLFCYLMLPALIAGTTPLHVDSRRNQNSQILLEIHGS